MTRAMYMSKLYAPTLKEDPADAELASHRLLLRAGCIRKTASGLYSYLPLAWRSLLKIEQIGGAACHTGRRSCFYREWDNGVVRECSPVVFDPRKVYGTK